MILTFVTALSSPILIVGNQAMAAQVFQPCSSSGSAQNTDVCKDVGAQPGNTDASGKSTNDNPIVTIIKDAIGVLSFIIGIGAVIGIVVSGFRIITAGGDSQAVASARSGLLYSVAGLAVAALAQAIVALVLDKIG